MYSSSWSVTTKKNNISLFQWILLKKLFFYELDEACCTLLGFSFIFRHVYYSFLVLCILFPIFSLDKNEFDSFSIAMMNTAFIDQIFYLMTITHLLYHYNWNQLFPHDFTYLSILSKSSNPLFHYCLTFYYVNVQLCLNF